ncbi:MAG: ferrous iron transport protein [Clostridiales bacterium]|jgi:ferrous iron transport protein A|nr:ferrous iron transport protein [Clostridiales bacterium]MDN5281471.1 ferrous iron transport protein [Candidatus Ozemobacter sp.]
MVKTTLSLAELPEGHSGTIRDIDTSSPTSQRLLDLGFVPGTPIKAIQKAPLGDPTTFQIRGYQLGLRKSEADLINIDVIPDEH